MCGRSPGSRERAGFSNAQPAGRLDWSSSLNFTPKASLFFDATKLLGDPYKQTLSSARGGAPRAEYIRYLRYEERTFTVGLRFRF